MNKQLSSIGFVGVFLCAIPMALSQTEDLEDQHTQQESKANSKSTHASISARAAYIDPKTGQLISAPDKSDLQNQQQSLTLSAPVMIEHENGMTQIKLNGHFRSPKIVSIGCTSSVSRHRTSASHPHINKNNCEKK